MASQSEHEKIEEEKQYVIRKIEQAEEEIRQAKEEIRQAKETGSEEFKIVLYRNLEKLNGNLEKLNGNLEQLRIEKNMILSNQGIISFGLLCSMYIFSGIGVSSISTYLLN